MKYKETIAIVNDPDVTLGSLENNNIKSLNAWELKWEEMTNSYDYIILGGHMGAYDADKHEYLLSENKWLSKSVDNGTKILGICLGFQQFLFCEGAKIVEQKKIYHGFQSNIKVITNKSLFKKGKIFKVGRYHSLKLKEPFKSNNFEITMRCLNSKVAMAFENQKEKIYGFQFHPESFLTINGNLLIKKILSA